MKLHNAVVGMKVQAKRACHGYMDEFIREGLICTINQIDKHASELGYELRLMHPDIDRGYAWVNASDVRRYKEEVPVLQVPEEPLKFLTKGTRVQVKNTLEGQWCEKLQEGDIYILQDDESVSSDGLYRRINVKAVDAPTFWCTQPEYFEVLPDEVPEEPQDDIKVGDSVLVGAEGAGNNCVLKEYAGLVCSVVDASRRDGCVEISHPSVMGGNKYTSRKKYLTKVTPKPKPKTLTLQDIRVGDWVVCSDDRYGLTKGVAYEVLRVHSDDGLYVSNPEHEVWVTGYATRVHYFNKVLREINDAASRVVESGSESTCRSEP